MKVTEEMVISYLRSGKVGSSLIGRAYETKGEADEFAEWFVQMYGRVVDHIEQVEREKKRENQLAIDVEGASTEEVQTRIQKMADAIKAGVGK